MKRSLVLAAMIGGCGAADKTVESDEEADYRADVGDGDGTEDLGCSDDDACLDWQICEESECIAGDRNNAFSEAEPIAPGDEGASGHINTPGDVDFWRYTSMGSEFIRVAVDPHDEVPDGAPRPDTFVTLYDPSGAVVTSADDYPNGSRVSNFDSVLYAYLAAAGDYVFVVEDANPLIGLEAWGGEDYSYRLKLGEWAWLTAGASTFDEPFLMGNEWTTGIPIATNTWNSVGVLLEEEGDVDYIALQFDNDALDGDAATWNDGILFVDGVEDLSGSDATPLVTVYGPDDLPVSQGERVGPNGPIIAPALRQGQWIVELADADGGGGPNHWYVVMLNADTADDNLDWESEPNNGSAAANAIEMTESINSSGRPFSVGSVQGFVDTVGDTDFFSISAPAESSGENDVGEPAQWVVLCMNSVRWGSAVAPDLLVYGADGTIVGESAADPEGNPNLRIENIEIAPGETLTLQVNPGTETEASPDEWYRLKAFIASFPVSSYEDGGYACP
ncbi:MAG: hypothetical protein VX944_03430 [Myxococcota bacterium]|nr:hypothetical protein [Myxococcota bacterium]MEC9389100.1 hypothetical protein [Myxococcota bacterium]